MIKENKNFYDKRADTIRRIYMQLLNIGKEELPMKWIAEVATERMVRREIEQMLTN